MNSRLIVCLLAMGPLVIAVAGKDVCAVRLDVHWSDGRPVEGEHAQLRDSAGTVISDVVIESGKAEFCDFDFGVHSILIGKGSCAAVEIHNIQIRFEESQKLSVIRNLCFGRGDAVGNACFVSVRVRQPNGQPIEGANIKDDLHGDLARTDAYGRALIGVLIKTNVHLTVSKIGFQQTASDLTCNLLDRTNLSLVLAPLQ